MIHRPLLGLPQPSAPPARRAHERRRPALQAPTKDSGLIPTDPDTASSPQTRFAHRIEIVAATEDSPSVLRPSSPPPVQLESHRGSGRSSTTPSSSQDRTSLRPPKAVGQDPQVGRWSPPQSRPVPSRPLPA